MTSVLLVSCDGGVDSTSSDASLRTTRLRETAIDQSDTYLTATVSVEFDATVQAPRPIYDATTGQTSSTLVLDSPPVRYSVEAGYDADGALVYNQTALDPPGDPLRQSVDRARTIRVENGVFEFLDVNGAPILGTGYGSGPTLQAAMDAPDSEILQLLDEIVVSKAPTVGATAAPDGSTVAVTSVSESGDLVTVQTQVTSSEPGTPVLPQRRIYRKTAGKGLSQQLSLVEAQTAVATSSDGTSVSGTATLRVENLRWSRNAARDQMRRNGTAGSPFGTPPDNLEPYEPPMCDTEDPTCVPDLPPNNPTPGGGGNSGNGEPGVGAGCGYVAGGANLVYVHGILSDSDAWGNPADDNKVRGRMRCGLNVAHDIAPNLPDGSHHDVQTTSLKNQIATSAHYQNILIGHSQGGLIARRAAQSYVAESQSASVRGIVTIGTPHQGANIARNLPTSAGRAAEDIFTHAVVCSIVPTCTTAHTSVVALRQTVTAVFIAGPAADALEDLEPNSDAVQEVNGVDEGPLFPRYGIQHYVRKRWSFFRVAGDLSRARDGGGPAVATTAEVLFYVSVTGSIASFFTGGWGAAAVLAWVAYELDSTDRWWNRITARDDETTDGVVQGPSQVYPNAILNRALEDSDATSHTGEADTYRSYVQIRRMLVDELLVEERRPL